MRRKNKSKLRVIELAYKVEETIVDSELPPFFLIQERDSHAVPITVLNYLSDYSRRNNSPNTVKNIAYALAHLYTFAKRNSIKLDRLIYSGETLSVNQIEQLRNFTTTGGNENVRLLNNRSAIKSTEGATNSKMET